MMDALLKKKAKGPLMSDNEKKSKLGLLSQISDMAGKAMGDDIKGLKKVEVAATDRKGLEEGLDKAKKLVETRGDGKPDAANMFDDDGTEEELEGDAKDARETGLPEHNLNEHAEGSDEEESEETPEEESKETSTDELSDEELDRQLEELRQAKAKRMRG